MQQIPLSKPSLTQQEYRAIRAVLKSGWLVEGRQRDIFEREFAAFIGAKYVIATDGATSAMFLSLKALNIGPGDEVILPALTFAATIEGALHCGARPILADVLPYPEMTLDPADVARKRTRKTRAVIPIHMAGIYAARDYDLPTIEDSAHLIAHHCMGKNIMAFSFHATKVMTTGRGGAVATNDKKIATWLKKARNFGISGDAIDRHISGDWTYDVEFPGWSHHMTDLAAALGRVQLKRLPRLLQKRQKIVRRYNELLDEKNKHSFSANKHSFSANKHSFSANTGLYIYPILVERRDQFINYMRAHGIQCNVHFRPLHHMSAFKQFATKLPVTDALVSRLVTLPLYPDLKLSDVNRITAYTLTWRKKYPLP